MCNLKQVGRSLYLLGKHKAALDVYEEAQRIGIDDWEIWHNKGLCNMYLKQYEGAADCFKRANAIQRHDATYMQLGKVYTLQEEYKTAIEARPATTPLPSPRLASPPPRGPWRGPKQQAALLSPLCVPIRWELETSRSPVACLRREPAEARGSAQSG